MIKVQFHPDIGAQVVDTVSGKVIHANVANISLGPLGAICTLEIINNFQASFVGQETWTITHPKTGAKLPVKSIMFADDSVWRT